MANTSDFRRVVPLEKKTENKFKELVEADGFLALKLTVGSRRGYPDRLVLLDKGRFFFIEFKRKGEKPRKLQLLIHAVLEKLGHKVYVADTFEKAKAIYEKEKCKNNSISKT